MSSCIFRFTHISTATLTLTAFDKFLNVYFPVKARDFCTVKIARRVMVVLVIFFVLFNFQWFFMIGYDEDTNTCVAQTNSSLKLTSIYKHFDAAFYSYIPISLMVIFNTAIISKLLIAKQASDSKNISSMSKAATGATFMLVGTSILFIILTLPYAIVYTVNSNMSSVGYGLIMAGVYCNHAVNFYLYTLTNSQIRRETLRLFGGKRGQIYPVETSTFTGVTGHM